MPSHLITLAAQAERALHRLEDSLDASRPVFITQPEAEALARLRRRWTEDTERKIDRELGRRD